MFKALFKKTVSSFIAAMGLAALLVSPLEARADGYFSCTPDNVIEFAGRVHVHCTNTWAAGADTISYIAIDKTDTAKLARFVSFAQGAVLAKKTFYVYLLTSSATNVSGCQTSNCRTPTVFGLSE